MGHGNRRHHSRHRRIHAIAALITAITGLIVVLRSRRPRSSSTRPDRRAKRLQGVELKGRKGQSLAFIASQDRDCSDHLGLGELDLEFWQWGSAEG